MVKPSGLVAVRPYDFLGPVFRGEVDVDDLDLSLRPLAKIVGALDDPAVCAAEMSISRYVLGRLAGDTSLIALPAFVYRGFRHRSFYVRSDSPLRSMADLAGRTVGSDRWSDSGTVWSRAALRQSGVAQDDVTWVVGPFPPAELDALADALPDGTTVLDAGESAMAALLDGSVDAVTLSRAPAELSSPPGSPLVRRLLVDYPVAERDYYAATGVFPIFHLVVARSAWVEAHPEAAAALAAVLAASWRRWWANGLDMADPNLPWGLAQMESATAGFPSVLPPTGQLTDIDRTTMSAFAAELRSQQLSATSMEPDALFLDMT